MYKPKKEELAFKMLMQEKPNNNHFDSGVDGISEECRYCRFHRPYWTYRSCVFKECPYEPGLMTERTVRKKKGGDAT